MIIRSKYNIGDYINGFTSDNIPASGYIDGIKAILDSNGSITILYTIPSSSSYTVDIPESSVFNSSVKMLVPHRYNDNYTDSEIIISLKQILEYGETTRVPDNINLPWCEGKTLGHYGYFSGIGFAACSLSWLLKRLKGEV